MAIQRRKVKSAERTPALLELFSREQRGVTVGGICESLKIPQPSVTMLLQNLIDLGYVEYNTATREYTPSIRVALLGSWIDRRFSEAGSIAERLNRLQRRTGETVFIGIQNGATAQYVMSQLPGAPDQLQIASGQHRSLTCSAMGRALLSLKTNREVISWVRRCNAEATSDRLRVTETEYLARIAEVRREGYAETAGDITPGLGAISITFRSPMGSTPLAVGVGGPIKRVKRNRRQMFEALLEFRNAFEGQKSSS